MKKVLTAVLCAATLALSLTACGKDEQKTLKVYMPDGAPAIALSAFMAEGYDGVDFTVVPSSEIAARVSNGDADMAILPVNQAATLYNGKKDIVMLSVNTHGNLYIVGGEGEISLSELSGKTVGAIGKGAVPDLTLRMLLNEAGQSYGEGTTATEGKISLSYYKGAEELLPLFKSGKVDYALLGEPAVTSSKANVAVDIQGEWQKAFGGALPQACLVARKSLVDSDKAFVDKFLTELKNKDGWAAQNPDKAVAAISANMEEGRQTTLKSLTADIVSRCNIKTVFAADAKGDCKAYFQKLVGLKDSGITVLANAPDDGFYYAQ